MKHIFSSLIITLCIGATLHPTQCLADHPTKILIVGTGPNCPQATFHFIQDAINAAPPGSQISVCAGVYDESLTISKPMKIRGSYGAVLMPAATPGSVASLVSANPIAPIIFVTSSDDVDIEGLTVDAGLVPITQCAPDLMGVYFQNSSGSFRRSSIRNTKLAPNLNGCQSGSGIFVQSGGGGTSKVEISENQIRDFQKNGITANEVGTSVEIENNIVIGLGPTTGAAQNGIQIGFGAQGHISHNFVANSIWAPCVSITQCKYFATGILVEESDGIRVTNNKVGASQNNIVINGDNAFLRGNSIFGSVTLSGILLDGNGAIVTSNRIVDSSQAAISIIGNNNSATDNELVNSPIGFLVSSSAVGFHHSGNDFDDIDVKLIDPPDSGPPSRAPYR